MDSIELTWFKLIQQDKEEGLRFLFDKYYTVLCRYVYTIIENEAAVEDIVQGVFIYLWENRNKIEITTSVKTYLYTSARNKSYNYIRDNKRFVPLSPDIDISVYEELSVETEDIHRLIRKAIESLPEKCKEIFQLSRDEGLSCKEIASRKGISTKTVESQIHIAIKKLRKYLAIHAIYFIFFLISLKG
jgi:RNA polymerase sigma-70 factor (ECF subfamily)